MHKNNYCVNKHRLAMTKPQKNTKVAILLDSRNYGGIETHVANLARGLMEAGQKVQIILLSNYGKHPVFDCDALLSSKLVKLDGGIFSLFKLLRNSDVNIVHTHGYKAGILGRLTCAFLRKPVVSTFHSGEKGNVKIRFYRWLDTITAGLSSCICVSEEIKKTANIKSQVIENFVEMPTSTPSNSTPKEHTLSEQIAFVGRLSFEKGPDTFLRLAKGLPQFNFCIYGDGPMMSEISNLATANVLLAGHVNSMDCHWQKINLLCITSREEGLPLVAIEALVRGIPVISYDIGGLSSVVINNRSGWLVSPFDERAFNQAIINFKNISAGQLNEMSSFSYLHIKNNFSSDAIIPKILNVYQKTLADKAYVQ